MADPAAAQPAGHPTWVIVLIIVLVSCCCLFGLVGLVIAFGGPLLQELGLYSL